MTDTIFALASGSPPAAIGVVRISGPRAGEALERLAGGLPAPRRVSLRLLADSEGRELDRALVLWFPGPASATGEDCAELHCHGGRAVIAGVLAALAGMPGLRAAKAGEFTRRAFLNGRIDLAQAEALGDLLSAETELQRRAAQAGVGGALSRLVHGWRDEVLALSALVEAVLDFADEDDVAALPAGFEGRHDALARAIDEALRQPRMERLRDGIRVVLAGPPNSGKSSLFNALSGEDAAIVSPVAGTTRDVIERAGSFAGLPLVLVDTAGLRESGADGIERIGIERTHTQLALADIVLWLGPEGQGPAGALEIQARCDDASAPRKRAPDHVVSAVTGEGIPALAGDLAERARAVLPGPGSVAINRRQAEALEEALAALSERSADLLLAAESLRAARAAFDRLLGTAGVEDMLDGLFGRFCIGK